MQEYYTKLKEGVDPQNAEQSAFETMDPYFIEAVTDGKDDTLTLLANLKKRLQDYFRFYASDVDLFEIVEVETEHSLSLPDTDDTYVMRLDLLARFRRGPYAGELALIDHKFVWDFYREDALSLNAQMPIYLGILQQEGIYPAFGMMNQIRTRVNKKKEMSTDDMFRRSIVKPSQAEIVQVFSEELLIANRVGRLKSLPVEVWETEAPRNMNNMTCPFCQFASLCKADLSGQDTRLMQKMDFDRRDEDA